MWHLTLSSGINQKMYVSGENVDNKPRQSIGDEQPPLLKLLCGADLLESFGTPGLWSDDDVSIRKFQKLECCFLGQQRFLLTSKI